MTEENLARLRAHRNNIHRYRQLLATQLTQVERAYIVKRLEEEQGASEALVQTTFPLAGFLRARLPSYETSAIEASFASNSGNRTYRTASPERFKKPRAIGGSISLNSRNRRSVWRHTTKVAIVSGIKPIGRLASSASGRTALAISRSVRRSSSSVRRSRV